MRANKTRTPGLAVMAALLLTLAACGSGGGGSAGGSGGDGGNGGGNTAPVATDKAYTTLGGALLSIFLTATDADGNALTYTIVSQPAHGTIDHSAGSASLTYTAGFSFTGSDTLTWKASDGSADSNTATVSITVGEGLYSLRWGLESTDTESLTGSISFTPTEGGSALTQTFVPGIVSASNGTPGLYRNVTEIALARSGTSGSLTYPGDGWLAIVFPSNTADGATLQVLPFDGSAYATAGEANVSYFDSEGTASDASGSIKIVKNVVSATSDDVGTIDVQVDLSNLTLDLSNLFEPAGNGLTEQPYTVSGTFEYQGANEGAVPPGGGTASNGTSLPGTWRKYGGTTGYSAALSFASSGGRVKLCDWSPQAGIYQGSYTSSSITWDAVYGFPVYSLTLSNGILSLFVNGVGAGTYQPGDWPTDHGCGSVTPSAGGGPSTPTSWKAVMMGQDGHTLALTATGKLLAWGENYTGQVGIGNTTNQYSPVPVASSDTWLSISAGQAFSLAVRSDGSLWAWGAAASCQLGNCPSQTSAPAPSYSPIQVGSNLTWKSVSAGYNHAFALRTDGTLWSWGDNVVSQAGYPNSGFPQTVPKQVGTVNTWKAVAAAQQHSVGLRTDGTLWTWGRNDRAQLGVGNITGPNTCVSSIPCGTSPVQVGSRTDWIAVTARATHSLALRSDGTLWAWGLNDTGHLGIGSSSPDTCGVFGPCAMNPVQVGSASNWVAVSTGIRHTVAVRSDGTLWVWGWNGQGQLNLGNFTQQNSPVQMGSVTSWASAAAGYDASSALRSDGSLWAWGSFSLGQLGIGSTTSCVNSCAPTQVQVP